MAADRRHHNLVFVHVNIEDDGEATPIGATGSGLHSTGGVGRSRTPEDVHQNWADTSKDSPYDV